MMNLSGHIAFRSRAISRRRLSRAALALTLLALSAGTISAQTTYNDRTTIAQEMTTRKETLRTNPGMSEIALGNGVLGPLTIRDPRSGSVTINGSGATDLKLIRTSSGFKLQVRLRDNSGQFMDVLPMSHDLPCDLEHSWLRRSWGLTFKDMLGIVAVGGRGDCYNASSKEFVQDYFMWEVPGILTANPSVGAGLLAGGMMEVDLMGREYNVPNQIDDPESYGLKDFMTFKNIADERFVSIVKRVPDVINPSERDTGLAKLAFTQVEFNAPEALLPPSHGKFVKRVTLEAHTHALSGECSDVTSPYGPDPDKAYIKLSAVIVDPDNGNAEETMACEWQSSAATAELQNIELWNRFDQLPTTWGLIDGWARFDVDDEGFMYLEIMSHPDNECIQPGIYRIMQVRSRAIPDQYCEVEYPWLGSFGIDPMTGELIYTPTNLAPLPVPCLPFATKLSGHYFADNATSATAMEYADSWPIDQAEFQRNPLLSTWGGQPNGSNNRYETGEGQWRPKSAYVYRTSVKGATAPSERIYDDAGVFLPQGSDPAGLRLFDWADPAASAGTNWLRTSTVQLYSPHGEALEEVDILDLHGAAKYAHEQTFPKLVAHNAEYSSVGFQSFEEGEGGAYVAGTAHAGNVSYQLPALGTASPTLLSVKSNAHLRDKGLLIRFWLKRTYDYAAQTNPVLFGGALGAVQVERIAQTGAWTLYEGVYTVPGTATDGTAIDIQLVRNTDDQVLIDDLRAQPYDAEMICYVYDPATWRLSATLDNQHFGLFYQYNGEGSMVRTRRETERGVMTVAESQLHMPELGYRDLNTAVPQAQQGLLGGSSAPMLGTNPSYESGSGNGPGLDSKVDLLDLNIGPDAASIEFLKGHERLLEDVKALTTIDTTKLNGMQLEQLDRFGLRDAERVTLLLEARALKERADSLAGQAKEERDAEARRGLEQERMELEAEWRRIVYEKLGTNEADLREIYRAIDDVRQSAQEDNR